MIGGTSIFVIPWGQALLDGLRGGPASAIAPGSVWRWRGRPVRLDGAGDVLTLDSAAGQERLHAQAASAVRRIYGRRLPPVRPAVGREIGLPGAAGCFSVSDGTRAWRAELIEVTELARPLVMFQGAMPPPDVDLRVIAAPEAMPRPVSLTERPAGVICFTPDTLLDTPDGPRRVADLAPGDRVHTRDAGAQPLIWTGARSLSGARLHAMPDLRPIRIRAGALGDGAPRRDLLVSPRHRILIRGPAARALFGTDEVLVAAEDLVDGRRILRDHALGRVTYLHLMLPDHQVVFADGVPAESFHPARTDLSVIDSGQKRALEAARPGVLDDPQGYGPAARRELGRAEAAILRREADIGGRRCA